VKKGEVWCIQCQHEVWDRMNTYCDLHRKQWRWDKPVKCHDFKKREGQFNA
jgi:hypothetical protein